MTIARTLAVACLVLVAGAAGADEASEKPALGAADAWLELVDAGRYGQSWDDAARPFKDAVTRAQWEQSLKTVRSPLGKVVSRKVASRTYTDSLPGAPDGTYVVIRYETTFEKKKASIETVTPMLDEDGRWRVSGYFIK